MLFLLLVSVVAVNLGSSHWIIKANNARALLGNSCWVIWKASKDLRLNDSSKYCLLAFLGSSCAIILKWRGDLPKWSKRSWNCLHKWDTKKIYYKERYWKKEFFFCCASIHEAIFHLEKILGKTCHNIFCCASVNEARSGWVNLYPAPLTNIHNILQSLVRFSRKDILEKEIFKKISWGYLAPWKNLEKKLSKIFSVVRALMRL